AASAAGARPKPHRDHLDRRRQRGRMFVFGGAAGPRRRGAVPREEGRQVARLPRRIAPRPTEVGRGIYTRAQSKRGGLPGERPPRKVLAVAPVKLELPAAAAPPEEAALRRPREAGSSPPSRTGPLP